MEQLEGLSYTYGDLRLANILLDTDKSIKVGDFDLTVRLSEQLLVISALFYKLEGDYEALIASAISKQYAVGSCIYNIRTRFELFYDLPGLLIVRKLINNEFPTTSDNYLLGNLILGCWYRRYSTILELKQAVFI